MRTKSQSVSLLALAIKAFRENDVKKAGTLFAESVSVDKGDLDSLFNQNISTSMEDRSLPIGDSRVRFKKDLDEDYEDVDSLEEIQQKREPKIPLVEATSETESTEEDSDIDEEVYQLIEEDPNVLPPSISSSKPIRIRI